MAEIETPLITLSEARETPAVDVAPAVEAPAAEDARAASSPRDERLPRTPRRGLRLLRLLNVSDPQILFYVSVLVNVPQIIVATLVFAIEARADAGVCDAAARARWRAWGGIHVTRLGATSVVAGLRWRFAPRSDDALGATARRRAVALVTNARNSLDALALVWFVVGNMWLLGGADDACRDATKSPIYVVDVAMLIVQYAQICLPCICAIAMVPIFCFCLPCVIRLLAAVHDPSRGRGASRRTISQLPVVSYYEGFDCGDAEPCCSVCISDYEVGDSLRILPCKHAFHKGCVDQWLGVNASCPLCRTSIFADDDEPNDGAQPSHAAPPYDPEGGQPEGLGSGANVNNA